MILLPSISVKEENTFNKWCDDELGDLEIENYSNNYLFKPLEPFFENPGLAFDFIFESQNNQQYNIENNSNETNNNIEINNVESNNIETNNVEINNVEINNVESDNIEINNVESDNIETNNIEINNIESNNIKTNGYNRRIHKNYTNIKSTTTNNIKTIANKYLNERKKITYCLHNNSFNINTKNQKINEIINNLKLLLPKFLELQSDFYCLYRINKWFQDFITLKENDKLGEFNNLKDFFWFEIVSLLSRLEEISKFTMENVNRGGIDNILNNKFFTIITNLTKKIEIAKDKESKEFYLIKLRIYINRMNNLIEGRLNIIGNDKFILQICKNPNYPIVKNFIKEKLNLLIKQTESINSNKNKSIDSNVLNISDQNKCLEKKDMEIEYNKESIDDSDQNKSDNLEIEYSNKFDMDTYFNERKKLSILSSRFGTRKEIIKEKAPLMIKKLKIILTKCLESHNNNDLILHINRNYKSFHLRRQLKIIKDFLWFEITSMLDRTIIISQFKCKDDFRMEKLGRIFGAFARVIKIANLKHTSNMDFYFKKAEIYKNMIINMIQKEIDEKNESNIIGIINFYNNHQSNLAKISIKKEIDWLIESLQTIKNQNFKKNNNVVMQKNIKEEKKISQDFENNYSFQRKKLFSLLRKSYSHQELKEEFPLLVNKLILLLPDFIKGQNIKKLYYNIERSYYNLNKLKIQNKLVEDFLFLELQLMFERLEAISKEKIINNTDTYELRFFGQIMYTLNNISNKLKNPMNELERHFFFRKAKVYQDIAINIIQKKIKDGQYTNIIKIYQRNKSSMTEGNIEKIMNVLIEKVSNTDLLENNINNNLENNIEFIEKNMEDLNKKDSIAIKEQLINSRESTADNNSTQCSQNCFENETSLPLNKQNNLEEYSLTEKLLIHNNIKQIDSKNSINGSSNNIPYNIKHNMNNLEEEITIANYQISTNINNILKENFNNQILNMPDILENSSIKTLDNNFNINSKLSLMENTKVTPVLEQVNWIDLSKENKLYEKLKNKYSHYIAQTNKILNIWNNTKGSADPRKFKKTAILIYMAGISLGFFIKNSTQKVLYNQFKENLLHFADLKKNNSLLSVLVNQFYKVHQDFIRISVKKTTNWMHHHSKICSNKAETLYSKYAIFLDLLEHEMKDIEPQTPYYFNLNNDYIKYQKKLNILVQSFFSYASYYQFRKDKLNKRYEIYHAKLAHLKLQHGTKPWFDKIQYSFDKILDDIKSNLNPLNENLSKVLL